MGVFTHLDKEGRDKWIVDRCNVSLVQSGKAFSSNQIRNHLSVSSHGQQGNILPVAKAAGKGACHQTSSKIPMCQSNLCYHPRSFLVNVPKEKKQSDQKRMGNWTESRGRDVEALTTVSTVALTVYTGYKPVEKVYLLDVSRCQGNEKIIEPC